MRRILIIKQSSLGDIIHALPFVSALKELYPDAHVSWLVNHEYQALLAGNPSINEIIIFDRKAWGKNVFLGIKAFVLLILRLRKQQFDTVFDLQGLFRSGLISFLTGGSSRFCFTYTREGSSIFYTKKLGLKKQDVHAVDRMLSVLESLGWQKRMISDQDFRVSVPERVVQKMDTRLAEAGIHCPGKEIIVINPFTRWESKNWPIERYAALADILIEKYEKTVIFSGTFNQQQRGDALIAMMHRKPFNFIGKTTLMEFAALLYKAGLLIASDSGPVHLANALRTRTITLFGPTMPLRTGAYLPGNTMVSSSMDCSPCFRKKCLHTRCMEGIAVEDVLKAIHQAVLP